MRLFMSIDCWRLAEAEAGRLAVAMVVSSRSWIWLLADTSAGTQRLAHLVIVHLGARDKDRIRIVLV